MKLTRAFLRVGCAVVLCASAALLNACSPAYSLWVVDGSTAANLSFGMSTERDGTEPLQLQEVYVYRCSSVYQRPNGISYPGEEAAQWGATQRGATTAPQFLNRFAYGEEVPGLKTIQGPEPLEVPGCYVVRAYMRGPDGSMGGGTLGFRIEADGTVSGLSRRELEGLWSRRSAATATVVAAR